VPAPVSFRRVIAEVIVALAGTGLVVLAIVTSQDWLDRHLHPSFFIMRRWYVWLESVARITMTVVGVVLALIVRPRLGRLTARRPGTVVAGLSAAVLAVVAAHFILAWTRPSNKWLLADIEPLRQPDARFGWAVVPNRTGHKNVGGRSIDFAFDANGYRVRSVNEPVDPAQPTILFTGESVMAGEGLNWDETIPAQVGALLRLQTANLAVHGYATDQSYMKLEAEWPRFARPVAIVTLFMTALFGRNLDDDRPHLDPGLLRQPAVEHGRLESLAKLIVPFRRDATVERGVTTTREVLRATIALAKSRSAAVVIIVPQFDREDIAERALRRRVLDDAGLPYVFVEFPSDWRLPGDLHPNPQTARKIAVAIADRLRGELAPER
jgi:hypothetical protein